MTGRPTPRPPICPQCGQPATLELAKSSEPGIRCEIRCPDGHVIGRIPEPTEADLARGAELAKEKGWT